MYDIFVSYSHLDIKYLDELKQHLTALDTKNIKYFVDTEEIGIGENARDKIKVALEQTKIAILLLSKNFFNSEFIKQLELPTIIESSQKNGVKIILVQVSPLALIKESKLCDFKFIHDPKLSLNKIKIPGKRDDIYVKIVEEIQKTLEAKVLTSEKKVEIINSKNFNGSNTTGVSDLNEPLLVLGSSILFDISKFTKRPHITQRKIVTAFISLMKSTLEKVAKEHFEKAGSTNFQHAYNKIIKIPKGNGLALIIEVPHNPFICLKIAEEYLNSLHQYNLERNDIDKTQFDEKQMIFTNIIEDSCDRHHELFRVRISISYGKGVVYKDINGVRNFAGESITQSEYINRNNSDPMQIICCNEFYNYYREHNGTSNFYNFKRFEVHKTYNNNTFKYTIYQLTNDWKFINTNIPKDVKQTEGVNLEDF